MALHGKIPVWRKAVKSVREMCDVCQTSIFNTHWTCRTCGIVACLDCFQVRKTGLVREKNKRDETDEYDWPMCNTGRPHVTEQLVAAQIIPGEALVDLSRLVHEARERRNIQQFCHRKEEIPSLFTEEGVSHFSQGRERLFIISVISAILSSRRVISLFSV